MAFQGDAGGQFLVIAPADGAGTVAPGHVVYLHARTWRNRRLGRNRTSALRTV